MTKLLTTKGAGAWCVANKSNGKPVIEVRTYDPRSALHVSSYIVLDELEEMRNLLLMATIKKEVEG